MPRYDVRCEAPICEGRHPHEVFGNRDEPKFCGTCGAEAVIVISRRTVPYFSEDRLRFWKGPLGNGYSSALGEQMPDSRRERDRLAKAKGVEFCTVDDLRSDSKEADDALNYREHVDTGGRREEWNPSGKESSVWADK